MSHPTRSSGGNANRPSTTAASHFASRIHQPSHRMLVPPSSKSSLPTSIPLAVSKALNPKQHPPSSHVHGHLAASDSAQSKIQSTKSVCSVASMQANPAGAPSILDRMRVSRQSAIQLHLYSTAHFWADKILSISGSSSDAYWLGQIYYLTGQFSRSLVLLSKSAKHKRNPHCRYLAAQCALKLERWKEAVELLADRPTDDDSDDVLDTSVQHLPGFAVKLESARLYLRGTAYRKQGLSHYAKRDFMAAVKHDIKCIDAFQQLIDNFMMTAEEEIQFCNSLDFAGQCPEDSEMFRLLYMSQLRKYHQLNDIEATLGRLEGEYGLKGNYDMMFHRADALYAQCKYRPCLEITKRLWREDPMSLKCLPIHLACLLEFSEKNELFRLSHELVQEHPDHPISWHSIGTYYLSVQRNLDARRFFSKATSMDPHFGAAWIGFGHSFAYEGEHDQAISAYSTARNYFPGMHHPIMFIGMQHLQNQNDGLAEEYLLMAHEICKHDPLLYNELGALYFRKEEFEKSIQFLMQALAHMDEVSKRDSNVLQSVLCNLGHAHRRLRNHDEARPYFQRLIMLNPNHAGALAAMALMAHIERDFDEAITYYHKVLALCPQDAISADLLTRAIKSQISDEPQFLDDDDVDDGVLVSWSANGEGKSTYGDDLPEDPSAQARSAIPLGNDVREPSTIFQTPQSDSGPSARSRITKPHGREADGVIRSRSSSNLEAGHAPYRLQVPVIESNRSFSSNVSMDDAESPELQRGDVGSHAPPPMQHHAASIRDAAQMLPPGPPRFDVEPSSNTVDTAPDSIDDDDDDGDDDDVEMEVCDDD
ncbi:uncharacterized protein BJ171DRAFT_518385 [Polychytrium aggregatum]|uniref:uncharacterized protein n=1 Tax=Polychytrium aggregatum TaxID=110093 RepID=UPI0022FE6A5C|nr:uncharacterized protein BJ171DRAFT_518385 [Polychytrium aggregatum]KAI9199433.1 hypothetical protein BJ171DRAFT_518385 [Polychytrium aggregatum]